MNTAINTQSGREFNRGILNAALCRVEGRDDEGVIFFDEIGEDGSVIDPAIVAAADRNGYTPAELCQMVAERDADREELELEARKLNGLPLNETGVPRGYSHAEWRTMLTAAQYGEGIHVVRGSRRSN